MNLTESTLFDYMKCPVLYDGIYNKDLTPAEQPSMTVLLNKLCRHFYANLMNGRILATSSLKKKWDSICESNQDYVTTQKCLDGISKSIALFQWAKDQQIVIADMDVPYKLLISGPHGATNFTGEIGTIAALPDGRFELLVTDMGRTLPDRFLIDMKLKYTLDVYAFKKVYDKDIAVHIHHVASNKDFYTYRTRDDLARLESTIDNVAFSIKNNLYYPHENTFCTSCGMKTFCRAWHQ
jgi:hypothetical protein